MKKRYFSLITFSLVLLMFLLSAGCGVRINGKEYELYKSKPSDKIDINLNLGDEATNNQEVSDNNQNCEQLKISSNAGNIDIRKTSGSQIDIKADKKVRGVSQENKKKILENMVISLENDGKVANVVVKTKDGKDFWDWQKENYKTYQVSINYNIAIPDSIKTITASTGAGNIDVESKASNVDLDTGAGNIKIKDMASRIKASTGAGNIEIKDTSAKENCKISTGAGNIDFEGDVDNAASFDASTGMGNVAFEVPQETKMSLDAGTGVGVLSGSFITNNSESKFHFNGDINGGGPSVKLNSGVGNVKVDQK